MCSKALLAIDQLGVDHVANKEFTTWLRGDETLVVDPWLPTIASMRPAFPLGFAAA